MSRGYSDVDDMSWKVRKSSAKLVKMIIMTRPDLWEKSYDTFLSVLTSRISENTESVRIEVLSTLILLVSQTRSLYGATVDIRFEGFTAVKIRKVAEKHNTHQIHATLRDYVPNIYQKLYKQMNEKRIYATKQAGFTLFYELMLTIGQCFTEETSVKFLPVIRYSLESSGGIRSGSSSSHLKIECMKFLRLALHIHPPQVFQSSLATIVPNVCLTVEDRFYKMAVEAVNICVELIRISKENIQDNYINNVYEVICKQAAAKKTEKEVREKAVYALGYALNMLAYSLPFEKSMMILLDCCEAETLQLVSIKAISLALDSPVLLSSDNQELDGVIHAVTIKLLECLKSAKRSIRIASLDCYVRYMTKYGRKGIINDSVIINLVSAVKSLLVDEDLQLLSCAIHALLRSIDFLSSDASRNTVYNMVSPEILNLTSSPRLSTDIVKGLKQFYNGLVQYQPGNYSRVVNQLLSLRQKKSNEDEIRMVSMLAPAATIAKCTVSCALGVDKRESVRLTQNMHAKIQVILIANARIMWICLSCVCLC